MIQQIDYPSRDATKSAWASPMRDRAREVTLGIMEMLNVSFFRYLSESGAR